MEFKKCERCGCFFASNNNVCGNCAVKDMYDINILNTAIDNSFSIPSAKELAFETGISEKNINRFIQNESFNLG